MKTIKIKTLKLIALIILIAIISGILYFCGVFNHKPDKIYYEPNKQEQTN